MTTTTVPDLKSFSPATDVSKTWNSWFCTMPKGVLFVQDTIHLAVKLKAHLLNSDVALKWVQHMRLELITFKCCVQSWVRNNTLRQRDVDHKDRQNFDAVLHIMKAAYCWTKSVVLLLLNITRR